MPEHAPRYQFPSGPTCAACGQDWPCDVGQITHCFRCGRQPYEKTWAGRGLCSECYAIAQADDRADSRLR